MTRPSPPEIMRETARLAYHLHWPLDTLLDLEHRDRRVFLAEADALARGVPPGQPDRFTIEPVPAPEQAWAAGPNRADDG